MQKLEHAWSGSPCGRLIDDLVACMLNIDAPMRLNFLVRLSPSVQQ